MTHNTVFPCFALLIGLYLAACHTDRAFDPIGRWSSKEGYEVTLRTDGTYQFCDRGWCSEGKLERPGNPGGIAITLVGFFRKENAARMAQELKKLNAGHPYSESFRKANDTGDLDFTANSGVGSASPNEFCNWRPCVLYGNLETGPNIAFTKVES